MSKQKVIYFLSAIVLIIGCYALNLSYSLFVQTEEKEAVSSVVPSLSSELSIPSLTLEPNEEYIIKETIKNNGTVSMNTILTYSSSGVTVKLVDKDNNNISSALEPNASYDVLLYVKNDTESVGTVYFKTNNNYTTLNNNLSSNISNTNRYTAKKSGVPYFNKENTLAYSIIHNYIGDVEGSEETLTSEELDIITRSNNKVLLPIYNDNIISNKVGNIGTTTDNYGVSYYFKDNTQNNYVSYANKLWRIIRINGNGSVRLISNDVVDTSIYNNLDSNIIYKGEIKEKIDNWYSSNLGSFTDKLSDEVFCVNNKDSYDVDNKLICDINNIYTVKNNRLSYPIATISYEEASLVGIDGYLNSNIWSLTSYNNDGLFVIKDNKIVVESNKESLGIRPVINLKSDLIVTGNGSKDDPYVLNVD